MGKTNIDSNPFAILQSRLEGVRLLLGDMSEKDAEKLIRDILKARRIFVTGKGRSGLVAECCAMRMMQMGQDVHVPGEATCPRIKKGDLMIAISCSGGTMTTIQLAKISKKAGAKVTVLTAVADSELSRHASHIIEFPVTERNVRKSYRYVLGPHNNTMFEEVVLLYFDALIYSILKRQGIPKKMISQRHTNLE